MLGVTAQLVALACHFNGQSQGLEPPGFFPSNSTCQFCEFVHFLRPRRSWFGRDHKWSTTASTPDEWIQHEARSGRKAVLSCQPTNGLRADRLSAGFVGGGGRWQLNSATERQMEAWEPSWEVGNREAADQRVWRVQYRLIREEAPFVPRSTRSLQEMHNTLNLALSDALPFCEQHSIETFGTCFQTAIQCLSANDPFHLVYHRDLAPPELLSLPAQQVLAACQAAWVFGGMGSWNDMAFAEGEQDRYERLSDALFALLTEAIQVGTNSGAFLEKEERTRTFKKSAGRTLPSPRAPQTACPTWR